MVAVKRSDPVYMAHAYLTKVPVAGIVPFLEAFTSEGEIVLDPFAGSGMTGVAALMTGRRARLFDVSVLGRHIGTNYVNQVSEEHLRKRADEVIDQARKRVGQVYGVKCGLCGDHSEVAKTVWSAIMECPACGQDFNFYYCLEAADWKKSQMVCLSCDASVTSRCRRLYERPVVDSISCDCSRTQIEQPHRSPIEEADPSGLKWPEVAIEKSRQMYVASALGRHGLTSVSSFYSHRNLCALAALREAIDEIDEEDLREKLRFAFTAILTRASKRYQWSRQRPLNAANANYYVAPVFYEWNVFDLFNRKVDAAIRSDRWITEERRTRLNWDTDHRLDVTYQRASAESLPLEDNSVDYVFTDPPFGANIFYSDMNLFQEAWLSEFTDPEKEAVIDRVDTGAVRTAERYEQIMTDALRECLRVVKPGGFITLLFGNSSGKVWQLLQRSIAAAGLEVVPELIAMLDKGQRSVKGLASGFENTATLDLMLTMRSAQGPPRELVDPPLIVIEQIVEQHLTEQAEVSPSLLYLELLRHGFRSGWNLSQLDLSSVVRIIESAQRTVDRRTALVV
ncbi:DNA methyltransferase [Candidatus Poriferisocius sp.]|uniref:DNA methyltransferase n=1 Tax=Candidatus Poriferisocius sp. TaxID=3101276 RepID=UPI003B01AC21